MMTCHGVSPAGFAFRPSLGLRGIYLVCHLHQLRRCAYRRARDDAAVLLDIRSLDDDNIEVVVRAVLCVVAIDQVYRKHGQVLVEKVDAALVDAL
jgi:hypothetical protein